MTTIFLVQSLGIHLTRYTLR